MSSDGSSSIITDMAEFEPLDASRHFLTWRRNPKLMADVGLGVEGIAFHSFYPD